MFMYKVMSVYKEQTTKKQKNKKTKNNNNRTSPMLVRWLHYC